MPESRQPIGTAHDHEISDYIQGLTEFYLRTNRHTQTVDAPPGAIVKFPLNNAYPRQMQLLIDRLQDLTDEIDGHAISLQLTADENAWKRRLEHYQAEQERAMEETPETADDRYQEEVVFPLLTGPAEGQGLHFDAVTPLVIANEAQILNQARWNNIRRFFTEDLPNSAIELAEEAAEFGGGVLVPILLGLGVLGVVVFAYSKGKA